MQSWMGKTATPWPSQGRWKARLHLSPKIFEKSGMICSHQGFRIWNVNCLDSKCEFWRFSTKSLSFCFFSGPWEFLSAMHWTVLASRPRSRRMSLKSECPEVSSSSGVTSAAMGKVLHIQEPIGPIDSLFTKRLFDFFTSMWWNTAEAVHGISSNPLACTRVSQMRFKLFQGAAYRPRTVTWSSCTLSSTQVAPDLSCHVGNASHSQSLPNA